MFPFDSQQGKLVVVLNGDWASKDYEEVGIETAEGEGEEEGAGGALAQLWNGRLIGQSYTDSHLFSLQIAMVSTR